MMTIVFSRRHLCCCCHESLNTLLTHALLVNIMSTTEISFRCRRMVRERAMSCRKYSVNRTSHWPLAGVSQPSIGLFLQRRVTEFAHIYGGVARTVEGQSLKIWSFSFGDFVSINASLIIRCTLECKDEKFRNFFNWERFWLL